MISVVSREGEVSEGLVVYNVEDSGMKFVVCVLYDCGVVYLWNFVCICFCGWCVVFVEMV